MFNIKKSDSKIRIYSLVRLIYARILGLAREVAMVWSAGDRATDAMPLEKSQMTTTIDSRVSGTLLSDHIGRKNTYFVYMTLGFLANLSGCRR